MNEIPDSQVMLNNQEFQESQKFINRHESSRAVTKSLQTAEESQDVSLLSSADNLGSKMPTKPMPLNTIPAQVMSMFSTTMSNNVPFAEIVNVLENMQNLDFDANIIRNSALGIYYETSKRVQFRLGLFLNPAKETILDCRRLKGDSFVMGNFFTILTNELSKKPELGVKVVLEDNDDDMNYFDEDEDDLNTLEELFGSGHLRLKNDPNLVKRLMREIQSSDMETQVNDTGLLAHAAELDANVETLATEGGKPLVNLLEGKLRENNAALVRQSAVLLKELTRMHPEIFSEQTAKSMVQAMGKWVPKAKTTSAKEQHELTSSATTVTNLAQGINSLMNSHSDLIKAVRLEDDEVSCIINTLQKYPSPQHDQVVQWMSDMVC